MDNKNNKDDVYDKYRNQLICLFKDYGLENVTSYELKDFSTVLKEEIKSKKEFKIYRYSKADNNNIKDIKYQRVHLSGAGRLNDIFEGLQIMEDIDEYSDKDFQRLKNIVSIACFSEKKDSLCMWGHYGDDYKGICVEYDLTKLDFKKDNEILNGLYPIIYSDKRYNSGTDIHNLLLGIKTDDLSSYENNYEMLCEIDSLYMVKSQEWEAEKEWRYLRNIYINSHYEELSRPIKDEAYVDMPCISAVYLGLRIDEIARECIANIIKNMNFDRSEDKKIRLYDMKLEKDKYGIKFVDAD